MRSINNWYPSLAAFLLGTTICNPAYAALSVDNAVTASVASGNTLVPVLTTVNTNDVIIIESVNTAATNSGISGISDTAGLTWTKRKGCVIAGVISNELWYAVSSGALTSDSITVTYNGAPSARVVAFGVNGANTATPFDTNVALPGCNTTTSGTSNTTTISTDNANDMIISFAKVNVSFGTLTPPTGNTAIPATGNPFTSSGFYEKIVAATQSSATNAYSWTTGGNNSDQIVDAIMQASPPPPPPPPVSATGLLDTAF
jgi:hypothetical protein